MLDNIQVYQTDAEEFETLVDITSHFRKAVSKVTQLFFK